jgi:predicted dehydrogenase
MKTAKISITGYGNIAYEENPKCRDYIQTHSQAIEKLDGAILEKIHDVKTIDDPRYTNELSDVLSRNFDLVVIASPSHFHFDHLKDAISSGCKKILVEKPVCLTIKELNELKSIQADSYIIVNFPRQFDLSTRKLVERIQKEEFGKLVTFNSICTKGLIHNGVHMINLLCSIFGQDFEIHPLEINHIENDLLGDFKLNYRKNKGVLSVLPQTEYSLFETTLYFEHARVEIFNNGRKITIFHSEESKQYNNFKELTNEERLEDTLGMALLNVYRDVIENKTESNFSNSLVQLEKLITLKETIA